MDEIQRSTSNSKLAENEDNDRMRRESYINDEKNTDGDDTLTDRGVETPDKFLHDIAPIVRIHHTHTHSLRHDTNNKQNEDHNSDSDRETETSDMPVVRTLPTMTHSKTDLNIESNTNDDNFKVESHRIETERVDLMFDDSGEKKMEEDIEYKSLNEYLNKHERFLRSIDRDRQLSLYERKQLDRQKEDLKKLQKKLDKQIEENDLKRRYEKQKEDEILRKKRAYLKRRVQETKLKEIRTPRIQTTFRLPIKEKRSKSQMTQNNNKANRTEPSSFSPMTQPKSIGSYRSDTDSAPVSRYQTHVASQTDANYSNKMNIERQLDKLDIHFQENPDDIGKNLKELIVHFVVHSKRSWIN